MAAELLKQNRDSGSSVAPPREVQLLDHSRWANATVVSSDVILYGDAFRRRSSAVYVAQFTCAHVTRSASSSDDHQEGRRRCWKRPAPHALEIEPLIRVLDAVLGCSSRDGYRRDATSVAAVRISAALVGAAPRRGRFKSGRTFRLPDRRSAHRRSRPVSRMSTRRRRTAYFGAKVRTRKHSAGHRARHPVRICNSRAPRAGTLVDR